ncbi:MAG TPA: alpha-galactosidase, partial [Ilumatobacteraceae bacterium]
LFPPELMGSHIGSPVTHTTGRRHGLGLRASAAMFGSMGIEWNLLKASHQDRAALAEIIATHKRLRPLLHTGVVVRLDHPDPNVMAHGVAADDRAHALFACTRLRSGPSLHTAPLRIVGLDPSRFYDIRIVPLGEANRDWAARRQPAWPEHGLQLSGRQLAALGFSVPVLLPETSVLLEFTARD